MGVSFLVVGLLAMVAWAAIMLRWRLGLYALIVYTPFTGLVVAAFAPSSIGNILRDIVIVIPLYIAFFLTRRRDDRFVLPLGFLAIVGTFAVLVALRSTFGVTAGTLVSLVGAKVWLFYIPLVLVAAAAIRTRDELLQILRLFVVMGWIPCTVGILMWVGAVNYDYKESIELLYGDFARNATQNFQGFRIGQSQIFRIPGTFQFASQYAMFCMFMILPALMQFRLDQSRGWRIFAGLSLLLFIAASLTSGTRGAFLHLPFLFLVIGSLRFGFGRGSNALVALALVFFFGFLVSQFDESAVIDHVANLAALNGEHLALGGIAYAIEEGGTWGVGVGMATIGARHVLGGDSDIQLVAVENYYAKAWLEVGLLGFLLIAGLFIYLIFAGIRMATNTRDPALRDVALLVVAMVVFIAYLCTRGWVLDQDPMAYYYWVMLGFLFKIPVLSTQYAAPAVARRSGALRNPAASVSRASGLK